MSLNFPHIIWPSGGLIDRVSGRVLERMITIFGRTSPPERRLTLEVLMSDEKIRDRNLIVDLPGSACFATSLDARTRNAGDQVKVLNHQAHRVLPLPNQDAVLIAQTSKSDAHEVQILQLRPETLFEIDKRVRKLGLDQITLSPSSKPEWRFPTPEAASRKLSEQRFLTLGLGLILGGIWLLLGAYAAQQEAGLAAVSSREASMRTALLQRLDSDRKLTALGELSAMRPELKTPHARLETLARITHANSDTTWWQSIEMQQTTLRLTGRSASAATSLRQIKDAFPSETVVFADNVSDASDGEQAFTIEINADESLR